MLASSGTIHGTPREGGTEDTAHGGNLLPPKARTLDPSSARTAETAGGWTAIPRTGPFPVVTHASGIRVVKGEDVMVVHPLNISHPPSTMFMICDGHSGIDAASFVATHFLRLLTAKLPSKLPDFSHFRDIEMFADEVRKALCQTFFHLDNEWALGGLNSGCTCTVALVTGWLITVANVGDSSAVLDTGTSILELTKSHRLHESVEEQARLKQARCELAPLGFHLQGPAKPGEIGVGPLRLWPGGLCVARSVGDLDAGPEVLPLPNIRQVMIPHNGCRLIMSSDGLWDVLTLSKACKSTRSRTTQDAASSLIASVLRDLRVMDDTTVLVIDALPADVVGWPSVVLRADKNGAKSSGGLLACCRPEMPEPDSRDVAGTGHLTYLADIDTLKVFPGLKAMLNRTMIYQSYHMPANGGQDFTQHGATPWRRPDRSNSRSTRPILRDSTLSLAQIMSEGGGVKKPLVEEPPPPPLLEMHTSPSAPTLLSPIAGSLGSTPGSGVQQMSAVSLMSEIGGRGRTRFGESAAALLELSTARSLTGDVHGKSAPGSKLHEGRSSSLDIVARPGATPGSSNESSRGGSRLGRGGGSGGALPETAIQRYSSGGGLSGLEASSSRGGATGGGGSSGTASGNGSRAERSVVAAAAEPASGGSKLGVGSIGSVGVPGGVAQPSTTSSLSRVDEAMVFERASRQSHTDAVDSDGIEVLVNPLSLPGGDSVMGDDLAWVTCELRAAQAATEASALAVAAAAAAALSDGSSVVATTTAADDGAPRPSDPASRASDTNSAAGPHAEAVSSRPVVLAVVVDTEPSDMPTLGASIVPAINGTNSAALAALPLSAPGASN